MPEPLTGVWQKRRFSAPQTVLWLIKLPRLTPASKRLFHVQGITNSSRQKKDQHSKRMPDFYLITQINSRIFLKNLLRAPAIKVVRGYDNQRLALPQRHRLLERTNLDKLAHDTL